MLNRQVLGDAHVGQALSDAVGEHTGTYRRIHWTYRYLVTHLLERLVLSDAVIEQTRQVLGDAIVENTGT
jgi:hypothetical protein